MPIYEFLCTICQKEVSLRLAVKELEAGDLKCPGCGKTALQQLITAFQTKTSKKS